MTGRIQELFHALADLTPAERETYFADHAVEEDLRRQVSELLAFDQGGATGFTEGIGSAVSNALLMADEGGARCGPFVLQRVIGRGGMGVVYLAERDDGEVRQRAAVKILQPGMADRQHELFLQERQILAGLSHPNIARLLDAGRREDGQPYLAMEFVEGRPIDEFAAGLIVREKVRLFLKVCAAVAYMHRNLVVHRDLKPGNILVTKSGEPKLLDFGIAKIVDLAAADATMTAVRMMTPDYASPEQILGERVGTQSDIYSLGAVLHQILTGTPPRRMGQDVSGAITAAMRQEPVVRPSLHAPALRGDLDAILLKALRHEPLERYGAVEQLIEDLEAYLDWRPVRARQGEYLYQARRFLRRYWLPATAAAVAVGGLAVGLYVANRERAIAQRRFDEVRQLSNRLFDIDARVRGLAGATRTRELIVDTSLEYLQRLAAEAASDPELALDVGTAYLRVGRVQGVPISTNLGQPAKAEENLQKAEELIAGVLRARPGSRTAMLRAAMIAHDRMVLAQARRPDTAAMPLARQAHEWLEKYLNSGPVEEAEKSQVVITGMNIANWYGRKALHQEALALIRRVIEIANATDQPHQAGSAWVVLSRTQRDMGDLEGALASADEAIRLLKPPAELSQDASRITSYGMALTTKGEILGADGGISMGRYREAAEYLQADFDRVAEIVRQDSADAFSRLNASNSGIVLGSVLARFDSRRALAVYDDSIRYAREVADNSRARRQEARLLALSVHPLLALGRRPEASRRLDASFALLRDLKLYPAAEVALGWEADTAMRALAAAESAGPDPAQGVRTLERLRQLIDAGKPRPEEDLLDATDLSGLYQQMADACRRASDTAAAADADRRRRELWIVLDRKMPDNAYVRLQLKK
ncbi:MAG: serine/threonine-protein kinase [Bryobacteraceae bacterium]